MVPEQMNFTDLMLENRIAELNFLWDAQLGEQKKLRYVCDYGVGFDLLPRLGRVI